MAKFKKGDIVYLNSGSPPLTVMFYGSDDEAVHVTWISDGKSEETSMNEACFTKTDPSKHTGTVL